MKNFSSTIVFLLIVIGAFAQSPAALETMYLGKDNHVTLVIPPSLADRLVASDAAVADADDVSVNKPAMKVETASSPTVQQPASAAKTGGYRVQVFADNNARTAKNEARARARSIAEQFPNYPTYVVYSSPYWRLRVGNFRTHDEADAAASEISMAFPAYAREIRVVRDRIVVSTD